MPVNYKKLWILLIERQISKAQLRKNANLSPATLTKLNKNEYVSMEVIARICRVLNCDIGDVVEIDKQEYDHI
ncbi:MAG: helix-turn-helix transcriptional regulator [Clostridia bacterium]|nr:helix-turn-helix transcriptional regulator [Clostridia bacterium]